MAWRLVSGSFQFSKNPPRKESEEACVQIFGQILIVSLIHIMHNMI